MDTESFGALPRYLVAFLHQMGPYSDYLKWNIAEASHKITLTLTWNFHCPLTGSRRRGGPAAKTASLWGKLQRTLRLPRAVDTGQEDPLQEESVPQDVKAFLRQTTAERAACLRQGNRVAVRPRPWSDTLKDHKRRLRSSLSLPDKIMGGGTAAFTPVDEYRSPTLRKDYKAAAATAATTSYPSTPTRSGSVQGNGRPPETLSSRKTISWPRFGDLLFVADSVGAIGVRALRVTEPGNDEDRAGTSCTWSCHDKTPLEDTYRSKNGGRQRMQQQQQPAIFIHRASSEAPSTDDDEQGQDGVTEAAYSGEEAGEGTEESRRRNNNHTVNQTVLKCLDSCDKILFRHSTTIT